MPRATKKPYRSPLRQAHARSTRMTILEAAGKLFSERGYAATSVDDIAEAAGVGRATVFASVGGKPALLKQAYDVAIVGDDEPVALVERPRSHAIQQDPDPRRLLAGYAKVASEIMGRVAGIYEAVRGAAGADPKARKLWEEVLRQRRAGMDNLVGAVASKASLREGLDREAAADIAWVLTDPWLYLMFVRRRGWTADRYTAWLAETLQAQLLPAHNRDKRRNAATAG